MWVWVGMCTAGVVYNDCDEGGRLSTYKGRELRHVPGNWLWVTSHHVYYTNTEDLDAVSSYVEVGPRKPCVPKSRLDCTFRPVGLPHPSTGCLSLCRFLVVGGGDGPCQEGRSRDPCTHFHWNLVGSVVGPSGSRLRFLSSLLDRGGQGRV